MPIPTIVTEKPSHKLFKDLEGKSFGRLTVVSYAGKVKTHSLWNCLCLCGESRSVLGTSLVSGNTTSCGCFRGSHRMTNSPTHQSWRGMKERCTSSSAIQFHDYGGRGIQVCARWKDFQNFYDDMGERPKGTSIDRIDNNKGYYMENCRWATNAKQARNKRSHNKTGVPCVEQRKSGTYRASFTLAGKTVSSGAFVDIFDAICWRKSMEAKHW